MAVWRRLPSWLYPCGLTALLIADAIAGHGSWDGSDVAPVPLFLPMCAIVAYEAAFMNRTVLRFLFRSFDLYYLSGQLLVYSSLYIAALSVRVRSIPSPALPNRPLQLVPSPLRCVMFF
jgi:hypothetical protein